MVSYRNTIAEINLDNWAHNLSLLHGFLKEAPLLCPMIKADAYGHGDVQLARVLEEVGLTSMGVCLLEEGLKLRQAGLQREILVFRSFDRSGARALADAQLTPVVSDWQQIRALESVVTDPLDIHLKFDTGMNRLGFSLTEAPELAKYFKGQKNLRLKALVTHLYNGEDAYLRDGKSAKQLRLMLELEEVFSGFDVFLHAMNSAGTVAKMKLVADGVVDHPLTQYNWGARPGIMTYGSNPLSKIFAVDLKPVMNFKSEVCAVRKLQAGETVSYGGTFTAEKPTVIAVIPCGYADGYHRVLTNKSKALIRGHEVMGVGNICMDYMMFDVTPLIENNVFKNSEGLLYEEVLLFGSDGQGHVLSADELAQRAQTISYEMMTSVSARVPRKYLGRYTRSLGGQ